MELNFDFINLQVLPNLPAGLKVLRCSGNQYT
jgi:hypothetical protein